MHAIIILGICFRTYSHIFTIKGKAQKVNHIIATIGCLVNCESDIRNKLVLIRKVLGFIYLKCYPWNVIKHCKDLF